MDPSHPCEWRPIFPVNLQKIHNAVMMACHSGPDRPWPGTPANSYFRRGRADSDEHLGKMRTAASGYARINAEWKPAEWWLARVGFPPGAHSSFMTFEKSYHDYVDRMSDRVNLALLTLQKPTRAALLVTHGPWSQ
jgi:hypothetical protein